MNQILCDILNSVISAYTDNLKKDDLKLSLMSSKFEMKDLKLYKFAFLQHDLPLIAENCVIRNISSYIPWTSFMKEPLVVNITDVRFYIKSLLGENDEFPNHSTLKEIREHQLSAHEQFKTQVNRLLMIISPNFIKSMLLKFVSQMKIKIERLNIVIAIGNYNLGVLIKEINIDSQLNQPETITKPVKIEGLSVYIDKNIENINTSENPIFFQQMNNIYNNEHNFIIKDFSTNATATIDSELNIKLKMMEINAEIQPWQVEFFVRTAANIRRFISYIATRNMIHTDQSETGFWKFVHNAAHDISTPKSFITKLREMKSYITNHNDSNNRNEVIESLDHSLDYYTVILYRMLAEKMKGGRKLSLSDYSKIFMLVETDGQIYIPNILFTSPVFVEIDAINIKISDFLCILNNFSFSMKNKFSAQILQGGFNSVQIKKRVGKIYTPFFESIEEGRKDFNFSLAFFNQNSLIKNKNEIAFSCSSANYVLNLKHLSDTVIDASLIDSVISFLTAASKLRFEIPNISFYMSPFDIVIHNGTSVHLTFGCIGGITATYKSEIMNLSMKYGKITFGGNKDILLADNIFVSCVLQDNKLDVQLDPPAVYIDLTDIFKLVEIIPQLPKINGITKYKIIDLLNILPHIKFSLKIPEFVAKVGFPLTSDRIDLKVGEMDVSGSFSEVKAKTFLNFKFDFKGASFDGGIFDKE